MKTNWIKFPVILQGKVVNLVSLERKHIPELELLAKNKNIWEFYAINGSDSTKFNDSLETACIEREKGSQFPFVIMDRKGKIIGSTRFLDIRPEHKKLEIGWTWLHPDYWGTGFNAACKLLLLTYCFEVLKAVRVQLKTDENNTRSRKAIEKIGERFEGILRNDMIRDNNTKRNSVYYSIIDDEWPETKLMLTKTLNITNE